MRRLMVICLAVVVAGCSLMTPDRQRYVVFFQEWSAQFDDSAKGSIAEAAKYAKAKPGVTVTVTGFADMIGSPAANKDISRLRAQMVTDELVADGVSADRIAVKGVGSVTSVMSSVEARRVEIVVGGY